MNTVSSVMSDTCLRMARCWRYTPTKRLAADLDARRLKTAVNTWSLLCFVCVSSQQFAPGSCVCFPFIHWGLCLELQKRLPQAQRLATSMHTFTGGLDDPNLRILYFSNVYSAGSGPAGGHVQSCPWVFTQEHHIWTLPFCCWSVQPQNPGL